MTELAFVQHLIAHFTAHCGLEIVMPAHSRLIRRASIAAFLLTLAASAALADEWSGIRVYLGDPRAAWSGESECAPCNRFCADIRAYNRSLKDAGGNGAGWRVGYGEKGGDGKENRIVLLKAMPDEATPYFVPVFRGVEDRAKRIDGYGGTFPQNVEKILTLNPMGAVPVAPQTSGYSMRRTVPLAETLSDEEPGPRVVYRTRVVEKPVYIERKVYVERPVVRTVAPAASNYHPRWTWPGELIQHLAREHSYSLAYLCSLSQDQLEALHDKDHDSGRVTSHGVQRWPAACGAAPRPAVRTYARSSGVQVFGAPFVGSYQQGWTACPGGRCP